MITPTIIIKPLIVTTIIMIVVFRVDCAATKEPATKTTSVDIRVQDNVINTTHNMPLHFIYQNRTLSMYMCISPPIRI